MRTVGLFEAKQKLSEIVERASEGERIGITRRGTLAAIIVPAKPDVSLKEVFDELTRYGSARNGSKVLPLRTWWRTAGFEALSS